MKLLTVAVLLVTIVIIVNGHSKIATYHVGVECCSITGIWCFEVFLYELDTFFDECVGYHPPICSGVVRSGVIVDTMNLHRSSPLESFLEMEIRILHNCSSKPDKMFLLQKEVGVVQKGPGHFEKYQERVKLSIKDRGLQFDWRYRPKHYFMHGDNRITQFLDEIVLD